MHPPLYDGWETDEQLRHFRRLLGLAPVSGAENSDPATQSTFRLDANHGVPAPHAKRAAPPPKSSPARPASIQHVSNDRSVAILAWTALFLGTTGFTCGLALIVWSAITGRQDLMAIGSPISLAGQIVLVVGLVLQLDRVRRESRRAAEKLEAVDEQLHDLKTTTAALGNTHGPSGAFYAHWAGGAGPDVLLGDLKSQLDLLAVKLSKQ
jgi:hypothetical protein